MLTPGTLVEIIKATRCPELIGERAVIVSITIREDGVFYALDLPHPRIAGSTCLAARDEIRPIGDDEHSSESVSESRRFALLLSLGV